MMRADLHALALRASRNFIRAEVWTATLQGGVLVLNPFVVAFGQNLPERMVHEASLDGRASRAATRTASITPGSRSNNTVNGTYLSPEA
jgi:hypothetical protein